MKKPRIGKVRLSLTIGKEQKTFAGPRRHLKSLLTAIRDCNFTPVEHPDAIPWREAFKEDIEKYGEAGLVLRGARTRRGLTQVKLAKKVGISQYNLSKMETGKRPIGKQMAKRLAKVLEMDYRVFL